MHNDVIILIAEDDDGHAGLIKKNLRRAGVVNQMLRFHDGQEILDFLLNHNDGPNKQPDVGYVLLLDIRMPKIDGFEVLTQIKNNPKLHDIPVIMVTTTDDPREVERCHAIGCNNYITKPVEYENFVNAVRQLGLFLSIVEVPKINDHGANKNAEKE